MLLPKRFFLTLASRFKKSTNGKSLTFKDFSLNRSRCSLPPTSDSKLATVAKNESTDFFASLDFVVDVIVLVAAAAVVVAAVVDVVVVVGAAAAAAAAVDVVVVVCDRSGVHVRQLFPQKKKMQNTGGCRQKLADFSQKNEIGAARPKNNTSIKQPVVALAGSPGSVTYRLKGFLKATYLAFFLGYNWEINTVTIISAPINDSVQWERY